MKADRLSPSELDTIAEIVVRGGLNNTEQRKLRDAVRYRRFKSREWRRPLIGRIYRLALDLWPRLAQDLEITGRAESKPFSISRQIAGLAFLCQHGSLSFSS